VQHFNKWFTQTFRKPSRCLISRENVWNTWNTGMACHCPSIHFSPYIRLFQSSWPMLYIFRALLNTGRKKNGGEGGRKGNSHLAFRAHCERHQSKQCDFKRPWNERQQLFPSPNIYHQYMPSHWQMLNKKLTWVFKRLSCWGNSVEE